MNQKSAIPKDAAAVILLNHAGGRVLWAQRNPKISFLGGYHAFPGGKLEAQRVYTDVSPTLYELAEKSVAAHLEKLCQEEKIQPRINT